MEMSAFGGSLEAGPPEVAIPRQANGKHAVNGGCRMGNSNPALDATYEDRWKRVRSLAYTSDTNKTSQVIQGLFSKLAVRFPEMFPRDGDPSPIVELGCGDGTVLSLISDTLRDAGITNTRLTGVELRADHAQQARDRLPCATILEADIFTLNFDETIPIYPTVILVPHVVYYGYSGKGEDKASLHALVENVANHMRKKESVGLFVHTIRDPLTAVKRRYAKIVETDSTLELDRILDRKGLTIARIVFPSILKFPKVEESFWKAIEYPEMANAASLSDQQKAANAALEFAIHAPLCSLKLDDRREYLSEARQVIECNNYVLTRFFECRITAPLNADAQFKEALRKIALEIQQDIPVSLDMST